MCQPEALSQIGISGLATRFYLGNPLLSHISYIQLGYRIFSLDELPLRSDGPIQPLIDGYVADSRSI
jgi:hypothetical protein